MPPKSRRAFFQDSGRTLAAGAAAWAAPSPAVPAGAAAGSTAGTVPVETVRLDPDTGLASACYGDRRCLGLRTHFQSGIESRIGAGPRSRVRELRLPSLGVAWLEASQPEGLQFECEVRGGAQLEFAVRITNRAAKAADLRVVQAVSGMPLTASCFAPSLQSAYEVKQGRVAFAYRGAAALRNGRGGVLSIPMVSFYDPANDLGFTVAAHIESPTAPFFCEAGPDTDEVTVSRGIRVNPGESATVRHFIIRHQGCWRPGLRWVRDAYPEYFMVSEKTVEATHGSFVYSNTAEPALCDELARAGVKNVEIHWTVPFFGKAVPEEEPWVKMVDDKWNTIKLTTDPQAPREDAPYEEVKRYVSRVTSPSGTRASVTGFIRDLKARGMRSYLYFNPTESWELFARQHFPECILRNADGSPRTTWFDHVVMDCRPESRWGQYLRSEMERLLQLYPEADGIFMDQSAGDGADNKVSRITDALGEIVRRHGKQCYWNGPYMIDLLKHAVGLLGELGPVEGERIKWLAIGNKVCCGLGHTEAQYQRNLLNGLWPPAPSLIHSRSFRVSDAPARSKPIPDELNDLHARYMHLYELFPGKTWFLGAHPLQLPEGVQGNIFERANGEYLVTVVAPGHNIAHGTYSTNAAVTVRVPDARRIRGVYLRSVNLPKGQYRVPFQVQDGGLKVTVPWLGSASLLWFAHSKAESGARMPAAPAATRAQELPARVVHAVVRSQGIALNGNIDSINNGLKTTAPLPRVPMRKALFNGQPIGFLESANSRHWHSRVSIGVLKNISADITGVLRRRNELVIEADGPADFFKIRNVSMLLVMSDGRVIQSKTEANVYSSCPHALAEGTTGSPIRIPIEFSASDVPD